MARLSIYLLGGFHATLDGEPITTFESNKVRALLAYLAVEADRPHSRDLLAGLLWPDQPNQTARRNLSQALFNLRNAIQDRATDSKDDAAHPCLQITRQTVGFDPHSDHWLDVKAFSQHIEADQPGVERLEEADRLYRGEFLAGFFVDDSAPFSEWVTLRRERLHRQVLEAQRTLANHYEQQQDYQRARHYAQRQVNLEPWREEAHRQMMRVLVRSGLRSAALQQYETCRRVLADELDIEPTATTRRLYRRIRSIPAIGQHNLPTSLTPFVGREAELGDIGRRLADPDCHLLTLVGPGGIGKTRLALQAAYENRTAFLHGVRFIPLATLPSAGLLVPAIADGLQLSLHGGKPPSDQLLDALGERELLLVLDNFEHLMEDGENSTDLLIEILQAAPEVTIMVTSRERLNIYGEAVLYVQGLEVPEDSERATDYSAVRLFLQCADRAQGGFTPDGGGVADVVRICRLVEGMPLGIELAAAWVGTLACQEIAGQIERSLALLSCSTHGIPARHRSVRAAFDHSWRRLPEEERCAFRRMSVFRGGFEREAATQVAGTSPQVLSALVDKSFVQQTPAGRYTLHELMRQYGDEKLGQDPREVQTTQENHCRTYAEFAHKHHRRFRAGKQQEALNGMEPEIDNLRAAWQWSTAQGRKEESDRLMVGLYTYYYNRSRYREGYDLLDGATIPLERAAAGPAEPETGNALLGKLLWRQANLRREFDAVDERAHTESLSRRSVALLRAVNDEAELAEALVVLGHVLAKQGRSAEAIPVLEESVEIGRRLEDRTYLAWALDSLGEIVGSLGDFSRGREILQESLAIHREWHILLGMAHNYNNLGALAYWASDYAEAKRCFLESQAAFEALGDPGRAAMAVSNAGETCVELGENGAAAQYLLEALQKCAQHHLPRLPFNTLHALAGLLEKQEQPARAYALATFVQRHPQTEWSVQESLGPFLAKLEAKLSSQDAAAARAQFEGWSLADVMAEVLNTEYGG